MTHESEWSAWFSQVGPPPPPLLYQSDREELGFVTMPLNSDGPQRGNCIPFAVNGTQKTLTSRNVTTMHWAGLFKGPEGSKVAGGTVSLDSGVDAANVLARFGLAASFNRRGMLAPIQINRNLPSGSRGALHAPPTILPRLDLDFKIQVPYDRTTPLVRNNSECLLDMERMKEFHFSDTQIRHHASVVGPVVANMFGLPPSEVAVVIMRSPIPAMDLLRVRRPDGTIVFEPRRKDKMSNEQGQTVFKGDRVTLKPSYWMIFQLRDHLIHPPSRVFEKNSKDTGLSALHVNVARLFRIEEITEHPTSDPTCNYQHPGLRLDASMDGAFRTAVATAISDDFRLHPEQWSIQGIVVDGMSSSSSSLSFLDNPRGQRLVRSTKTHDCVYHDVYRTEGGVQIRSGDGDHCPFSALTHVCIKKGTHKVPVPPVRFEEPAGTILPQDIPLLRSKSMAVEFVLECDGGDLAHFDSVLQHREWGPVVEQAITCPYVTSRVAEDSRGLRGKGVHLDGTVLRHDGCIVARPADPFVVRQRTEKLCKTHKWTVPRTLQRDEDLYDVVRDIISHHFTCLNTAAVQSPYCKSELDTVTCFDHGYPYVRFQIGKPSMVLRVRSEKITTTAPPSAILVIPADDTHTGSMSLYCGRKLSSDEQHKELLAVFKQDPSNRGKTLQPKIGTYTAQPRGYARIPVSCLHQACHHRGSTPIYFVVEYIHEKYWVHKACSECTPPPNTSTSSNLPWNRAYTQTKHIVGFTDRLDAVFKGRKRRRSENTERRMSKRGGILDVMEKTLN